MADDSPNTSWRDFSTALLTPNRDSMARGFVYVLTNEHMPGLVKIGRTSGEPIARASQLYQTGVPGPFVVAAEVFSPDCVEMERLAHENFAAYRVSKEREFFRVAVKDVGDFLASCLYEQIVEVVTEFLPDHEVILSDERVCSGSLSLIADALSEPVGEIARAMSEMEPEELAPAIVRRRQRRGKAKDPFECDDPREDEAHQ